MAFDQHKNFAYSTVATAPSPATSGTSLVVAAGHGTRFPAVPFNASVWPIGVVPTPANAEVVRVTAISTDTFTITRAEETSSARSIIIGDQIAATITAKTLTDVEAATEPIEQTTTATGSQNNFSLSASNTILRCTGASPSFTGFSVAGSAPTGGDRVLIICLGTSVHVAHANASSTDENRVNTPSLAGQIVGVDGMMLLVYDDTTNRWRETLLDPGAWITPTYTGGDYTASSGTWTVDSGDVITLKYQQIGRALQVIFNLQTTSVSATPFALRFNAFGYTLTSALAGSFVYFEGGVWGVGSLLVAAAATTFTLAKDGGGSTNWTTETNAKMVEGSCVVEIN